MIPDNQRIRHSLAEWMQPNNFIFLSFKPDLHVKFERLNMKRVHLIPALITLIIFSFTGCKQSTEPEEVYPEIPNQKLEISISENHPDTYAQMVRANVLSFTFFNAFIIQPSGNGWVKNGNTWSFTSANQDGVSFTYKLIENTDSFAYQYILNGNMEGVNYVNFVAISGSVAKNGQTAEWKLYETENGTDGWVNMDYDYFKNPTTKVQSVEYKVYSSETHEQVAFDYSAAVNSDKSGTYVYYLNGTATQEATWAANGSGSLKDYSGELTVINEWSANP